MTGALSFCYHHRVTYAECTVGNHVYHARFLDVLEAARGEFVRHLGTTVALLQEQGVIFPVIECQLRYLAPARYDDLLAVQLWISDLQRIRLAFGYRVTAPNDRTIVEATTVHVCTNLNDKPRRIPEELQKLLSPYRRTVTPD